MKAKDRHKLKSNELADSIRELSEFLGRHANKLLAAAVVVVLVVVGGFWINRTRANARYERIQLFQRVVSNAEILRLNAVQNARVAPDENEVLPQTSYNVDAVITPLAELAQQNTDPAINATTLLAQADAVRSQLYFTGHGLTDQEKTQICQKAEQIFQRVINEYPPDSIPVVRARFDMALLAEDQGDWSKAREVYQKITLQTQGPVAGTSYPFQARRRLASLDKLQELKIEFPPPEVLPSPEATTGENESEPDKSESMEKKVSPDKSENSPAPQPPETESADIEKKEDS